MTVECVAASFWPVWFYATLGWPENLVWACHAVGLCARRRRQRWTTPRFCFNQILAPPCFQSNWKWLGNSPMMSNTRNHLYCNHSVFFPMGSMTGNSPMKSKTRQRPTQLNTIANIWKNEPNMYNIRTRFAAYIVHTYSFSVTISKINYLCCSHMNDKLWKKYKRDYKWQFLRFCGWFE